MHAPLRLEHDRTAAPTLPLALLVTVTALLALSSFTAAAVAPRPGATLPAGAGSSLLPPPPTAKNVTVGKGPSGLAEDLATGEIYVTNSGSNTVSVINGTTVVKTIPVGKGPSGVTYDPKNKVLYVVNSLTSNVSVLNGTTHKVVGTIAGLTSFSGTGTYDPANGAVYLLSQSGRPTYYELARLATKSPWTMTLLLVGQGPYSAVYDPATTDLVTFNFASNNLSVVNSSTNAVKTVGLTVGTEPNSGVYNSNNKDLYVVDEGPTLLHPRSGNISVLGSTNTIVKTLSVGPHPVSATYDPNNHDVYVVNETYVGLSHKTNSSLTPITASNSVKTPIKVGQGAFFASYDPANQDIYVAEAWSNLTAVIKGSTNALLTSVTTTGTPLVGFYDPISKDMALLLQTSTTVNGKVLFLSSPTSGNPTLVGSQVLGKDPVGVVFDLSNSKTYVPNGNSKSVTVF